MEDAYAPALALQKSSTKEPDYKYGLVAGWIFFSSAHKPIDFSETSLETVQGESAGVGRLDFFERDLFNSWFKNMLSLHQHLVVMLRFLKS
tara:strand:- start:106 stop:378 length:273 start_codon:yes stop_codon:yes gene_type:complete